MRRVRFLMMIVAMVAMVSCSQYRYERVSGDPTKTRIYTLDNGLKVYMSVNRETPRINTLIAVRVGSKNDPAETTGLAHYFEHLMFKGTESVGTQDYEAEKPLLDEIERLFEVYRATTDDAERKAIYAQIDSVSQEAAKYAIPNEYDKLMTAIGAEGSNAWTSYDETTYIEDIPSNQLENWAKVESDRFANSVIRGFHTELETVYEEYNMGLTRDTSKAFEKLISLMIPNHPYGTQTVIGTQEHLKNPSITNIKNYYKTYYVPNNMAICMAGDFNPDEAIRIIDKYFGQLTPNENLPEPKPYVQEPIAEPKEAEVYGLESELVIIGWPTEGAAGKQSLVQTIAGNIMDNGKCGLVDVDLLQRQRVLQAGVSDWQLADAGVFVLLGIPKQGQSIEEVRDLLLAEVAKLRNGEFDETLLSSIVANFRLEQMQSMQDNSQLAYAMHNSFINGVSWRDIISIEEDAAKITKEDIVAWANATLPESGYSVVYKRQGEDKEQKKIDKPHITPIPTNRDESSEFLTEVQNSEVKPIEPVFVDFDKDMSITKMNGNIDLLYKKNEKNGIFSLIYLYDFGCSSDPAITAAVDYMELLGTDTKSLEEIQNELYALACNFRIVATNNRTYVVISGLAENMTKAVAIAEDYIANVKGDDAILAEVKNDIMQMRSNALSNQRENFSALRRYCFYGPEYIRRTTLDTESLAALSSDELLSRIKSLPHYKHKVLYYGPESAGSVVCTLNASHNIADELQDVPAVKTTFRAVSQPEVLFAQYDAKQIYYMQYSCNAGDTFDVSRDAKMRLYNSYFSGNMNAIVFQEMREARGLAYSAYADYMTGAHDYDNYAFYAFIATQNDKMRQAVEAFDDIIENMPQSEAAFELAKQGFIKSIATWRTTGENVLWSYIDNCDMGVDVDRNKAVYEAVQSMTLQDVVDFQQEYIKNRTYSYCILGDRNDVDLNYLSSLGKITFLSQKDIFGY